MLCMFYDISMQAVRQQYHSKKYQEDTQNQMLVFEKKMIVLDLPAGTGSEPKVVDGWKIRPLTYPQVKIILQCVHLRDILMCL